MPQEQPNNPLHGIKLADIVNELVDYYGWDELGINFDFRCFRNDPSVKSTLKFLRRQQWARDEIEAFYIKHLERINNQSTERAEKIQPDKSEEEPKKDTGFRNPLY